MLDNKFVSHIRTYCRLTNQVIVVLPDIYNPLVDKCFAKDRGLSKAVQGRGSKGFGIYSDLSTFLFLRESSMKFFLTVNTFLTFSKVGMGVARRGRHRGAVLSSAMT